MYARQQSAVVSLLQAMQLRLSGKACLGKRDVGEQEQFMRANAKAYAGKMHKREVLLQVSNEQNFIACYV